MRKVFWVGLVLAVMIFSGPREVEAKKGLFFDQIGLGEIKARAEKSEMVKIALDNMVKTSWGSEQHWGIVNYWVTDIIENSLHWKVTGNILSKEAAISTFLARTSGEKRYGFRYDSQNGKNYGEAMTCTGLAIGYDFLYDDLGQSQRDNARRLLAEWGRGWFGIYKDNPAGINHNFNTGAMGCLGLIGLDLEDDGEFGTEAKSWVTFMANAAKKYYFGGELGAYNLGGDPAEGNGYRYYGSGPMMMFAAAYQRAHGEDLITNSNAEKYWDYQLYLLMSDGQFPSFGDNSGMYITGEDLVILDGLVKRGGDKVPEYVWLWQRLRPKNAPMNPQQNSRSWMELDNLGVVLFYPIGIEAKMPVVGSRFSSIKTFRSADGNQGQSEVKGGMASMRSGWGKDEVTLWLINRWRWQNHMQYDPDHFLLSAYGEQLIVNRNGWEYNDPMRGSLSQQNTVLFDWGEAGSDMPRAGFVSGTVSSLGKFTEARMTSLGDVLRSDSRYSHQDWSIQPQLLKRTADGTNVFTDYYSSTEKEVLPMIRAERMVVMVKGARPWVIMVDDFEKDADNHRYTWQGHLPLTTLGNSGAGTVESPYYYNVGGAEMKMVFVGASRWGISLAAQEAKRQDRALQVTTNDKVRSWKMMTVLLPGKTGENGWKIGRLSQDNPVVLEVSNGAEKWKLVFDEGGGQVRLTKNGSGEELVAGGGGALTVAGDANGDGKVDLVDLAIWKQEYLSGNSSIADLAVWKTGYLK